MRKVDYELFGLMIFGIYELILLIGVGIMIYKA